jgi:hypothetical protein
MRKVIISKRIHSSFASMSSNDENMQLALPESEIDFNVKEGIDITSVKHSFLNGEKIKQVEEDDNFLGIYLEADKTFYNKGLRSKRSFSANFHDTPEFKELVNMHLDAGWSLEIPEEYKQARKNKWKNDRIEQSKKAKKEGYVLWMDYEDYKPEFFQGGFSDELFNTEKLKNYIGDGKGVFGWIGSTCRKTEHDKVIEKGLRERHLSLDKIACWLTSTDGRHFSEHLTWKDTLKEEKKEIKKNLNRIFNLALIYSSDRHEGNLKSTNEIRADYEKEGILLPEDGGSYDENAHFKLMAALFKHL